MGKGIFRFLSGLTFCLFILGCASPSGERGEPTPAGEPDGVFGGARSLPPEMRAEIEQQDAEQAMEGEGAFANAERGSGSDAEEGRHGGMGALYYFYVGLAIVLFLYLVWLIRSKHHAQPAPQWRLK